MGSAGVGEGDTAQLDGGCVGFALRNSAAFLVGGCCEQFAYAPPRYEAARDVLREQHDHDGALQQEQRIGYGGHDVAGRGGSRGDVVVSRCQHERDGDVSHRAHHGVHEREDDEGGELDVDQLVVRASEAALLVRFAHVGFDGAQAGDVLLHDGVDGVDTLLQLLEQGVCFSHAHEDNGRHNGAGDERDVSEACVEREEQHDAARYEQGHANHHAHEHRK